MRRPRIAVSVLAAVVLVAGLIYSAAALFRASGEIGRARRAVAEEGRFAVNSARLDRKPATGFETIDAPASFRDAVLVHGRLYLCGPGGLFVYSAAGAPAAQYRTGFELPPAPPVAMATGVLSDAGEPELLIATAGEGLLAFNGTSFRQVRAEDPNARTLTSLLPLASGRVLLGTQKKGLLVWDGRTLSLFHPAFAGIYISALAGDESSVWVGTADRGVFHWHAGQIDRFGEAEGLPDPRVLSIAVDDTAAYVGTAMGVTEFRGGRVSRQLAPGFFANTLLARKNALAVGTLEDGVIEVPLAERKPRPARGHETAARVERLLELDGKLYALAADGLYSAQDGDWSSVLQREGATLADRNISALDVDASGRIWAGCFDRGLDIIEPDLRRVTHVEDEHVFCVNRVVHDSARGVSAVATANGLVLFDSGGRERRVIGRDDGLIANHVTDVALVPGGMVAATPAGLTFIDAGGMRSLYAFHGLVNNHVYALGVSGDRVFAGTLGGLSILERGLIAASFTTANSALKHNWITAIAPAGDAWFIGTYGGGLFRLDAGNRWDALSGALEVNPNAMAVTAGGVFAGTLGRGLLVWNRVTERSYAVTDGLPSANVTAVAAGGGYLYIGTDNGLVRVPEGSVLR